MIWIWILSGVLFLLGALSVTVNLGLTIHYYIAKLRKVDPLPTGSMIPIIGGLSLSIVALIIPVDLNGNRLLYAGLLFTDPSVWMLLYLPIYLLLEKLRSSKATTLKHVPGAPSEPSSAPSGKQPATRIPKEDKNPPSGHPPIKEPIKEGMEP